MDALARLTTLCLERYNLAAPDPTSDLFAALETGDAALIREEIDGREFYQWRGEIYAALDELAGEPVVVEPDPEPQVEESEPEPQVAPAEEPEGEPEAEVVKPTRRRATQRA